MIDAQRVQDGEIAQKVKTGKRMKEIQKSKVDAAIRAGSAPDMIALHPGDIHIDDTSGYSSNGPFDDTSLNDVLDNCRLIDMLLLQHALEQRMDWLDEEGSFVMVNNLNSLPYSGSAQLLAMLHENYIPERFRRSLAEHCNIECNNRRKSKR